MTPVVDVPAPGQGDAGEDGQPGELFAQLLTVEDTVALVGSKQHTEQSEDAARHSEAHDILRHGLVAQGTDQTASQDAQHH